jgi:hypothetical protein
LDTVREEESAGGGVIKHAFIIALDAPDGAAKLGKHKDEEVDRVGKVSDFGRSGKVHE